jgi:hypothetical protein
VPPRRGLAPVEYAFSALDKKEAATVATWTASATKTNETIVVSFANSYCPVCGDDALPPKWSPARIVALAVVGPVGGDEQIVVRCGCLEPHPGRPVTEAFGCGRVWTVSFTWDSTPSVGPVTPGPKPSTADIGFAAQLADLKATELTRVRAQAQGWATVMAGLTGLVGIGQVFASQGVATSLAAPWRDVIGASLLLALVAAAASSVMAGLAAYGKLETLVLKNTAAAGGEALRYQGETDRLVKDTKRLLELAALPAAAAFALVVFSSAVMWWAPQASTTAVCVAGPDGNVTKLTSLPNVTSGSINVVACAP